MPKEFKYTDIGSIELSDTSELKVKIVDDEYVDFRIWMKTEKYTGPTKRGIRFYLFDSNFEEFCKLIEKVKKVYEDLA